MTAAGSPLPCTVDGCKWFAARALTREQQLSLRDAHLRERHATLPTERKLFVLLPGVTDEQAAQAEAARPIQALAICRVCHRLPCVCQARAAFLAPETQAPAAAPLPAASGAGATLDEAIELLKEWTAPEYLPTTPCNRVPPCTSCRTVAFLARLKGEPTQGPHRLEGNS